MIRAAWSACCRLRVQQGLALAQARAPNQRRHSKVSIKAELTLLSLWCVLVPAQCATWKVRIFLGKDQRAARTAEAWLSAKSGSCSLTNAIGAKLHASLCVIACRLSISHFTWTSKCSFPDCSRGLAASFARSCLVSRASASRRGIGCAHRSACSSDSLP